MFLAEDVDGARLHRGGAGGIGAAVERWHVVEGLAVAEQAQDLFAASGGGSVYLDESGLYIVEAVAARAFEQDDAFARDLLLAHEARDARHVGGTERGEEINLADTGWLDWHWVPPRR